MMLNITIVGGRELIAKFASMPARLANELLKSVTNLALALERHVKNDKLQGQVLNHIIGHLQQSIHNDVKSTSTSVTGRVYSAQPLPYAAIHEYGFTGAENVKPHERIMNEAFGRPLKEAITVQVRGFTRNMNMPERSYMRSSLADFHDQIVGGLTDAVLRAAGGKA